MIPRLGQHVLLLLALCSSITWSGAEADADIPTLHFFYSPTCVHCHPIKKLLARIEKAHPSFVWEGYPLTEPANIELMAEYYIQYEVPEEEWSGTLAIFFSDGWWVDGDQVLSELEHGVQRSVEGAARPAPEPTVSAGANRLLAAFEGFSVVTILAAGLLDGINPCALATIIFLLSYLVLTRRRRGQVLAVGLAFAAGVFLAYLAVGMGALRVIGALEQLTLASKLVYPVLAVLTLTLAAVTIADYRAAAKGNTREIRLKLPRPLSLASHSLIRRLRNARSFVPFAFVAGILIAMLELFCTGQIYLPTLMYMWSSGIVRAKVLAYLVLYVTMFTVPIVLLTGMIYAGMSAETIARMARERLAAVKLATAGLFMLLGVYLAAVSLQVFGVY